MNRSGNNGTTWTPIADALPTLSVGGMGLAPDGTLWVATGEATPAPGLRRRRRVPAGVARTGTFTASTGDKIRGTELDSQMIRRVRFDDEGNRVFVATSRGL